jgi:transcriptional regulator with XRE-family HTH domain
MSIEVPSTLSQRLVSIRSRKGISQKTVARMAGLDSSYLSRIETGKVQPTVRTVMKIGNALKVSANELLGPALAGREGQPCPVSPSGRCLVELIQIHATPTGAEMNSFTPLQLRVVKRFAQILQQRRPEVIKALDVLFAGIAKEN